MVGFSYLTRPLDNDEVRSRCCTAYLQASGAAKVGDRWTAREEGFDSIRPLSVPVRRPQHDLRPCDTSKTHHENNSDPGTSRDHHLDFSAVLACLPPAARAPCERASA
jgi:hypothetical protein